MRKAFYLLAAIAVICWLASCRPECGSCAGPLKLTSAGFPLAVNDQWTYRDSDNISGMVDTALFVVTGTISTNSDSTVYATRTTVKGVLVDSGTILSTANNVVYRPGGVQSLFSYLKLTFPMLKNSAWSGYYPGDTMNVSAIISPYPLLGTNYTNAFNISRSYLTPGFAIQATLDIIEGIGIVEENISITSVGPGTTYRTLKLIAYTVY